MRAALERAWRDGGALPVLLAPLAALYGAMSERRAAGYRDGRLAVEPSALPVVVVGNLTVGGTDSRYYEPLTDNVFRFSPLLMERDDLPRMHGTNERVAIDTLANASGFYYRLLQSLAD